MKKTFIVIFVFSTTFSFCQIQKDVLGMKLILSENVIANSIVKRESKQDIVCISMIDRTANLTVKAENSIFLNSGFYAEKGAFFYASIEDSSLTNSWVDNNKAKNISTLDFGVFAFPNPCKSIVNVVCKDAMIRNISVYRLLDSRLILNQNLNNLYEYELDVSAFEKGIYLISIKTSNEKTTIEKLIKN